MHENRFTFRPPEYPDPKQKSAMPEPKPSLGLDAQIMIPPSVRSHALLQKASHPPLPMRDDMDDDNATVSTKTEDDPVHLAMHAVEKLSSHDSDDMEEDEVLYPKQSVNTPIK